MSNPIPSEQLLGQLNWRYATKQFDPQRKISATDWASLEEALVLSPSSGGLQPWSFVIVTDLATREKLTPASFGQSQITQASHLVVFTAKKHFGEAEVDAHLENTAKTRGIPLADLAQFRGMLVGGIVNSMDDAARLGWAARQTYIALGNLLTSAALLGIDACPMEGFVPSQYDEILGLADKGLTATVICALGYRTDTDAYASLPKVRFPKESLLIHI